VTSVTSGPHKDIGSPTRPMTEEELNITQTLINEIFLEFKQIVIDKRGAKLDPVLFAKALDGRILSGRQAKTIGLVDETGSKKDAIMKAADLANISYVEYGDIRICKVSSNPEDAGLFSAESLMGLLGMNSGMSISYK